jgi:hypothetical protein
MTEYTPRLFTNDAAITHVGEGLLARTLPRPEWTHEAHLAACLWLVRERPEIALEQELPGIIRSYNESVGGINDDTQGYHETLTQFYLVTVRAYHNKHPHLPLVSAVNGLLQGPLGKRDWPMRFYSADLLFSVGARRKFVDPDLLPLSAVVDMG